MTDALVGGAAVFRGRIDRLGGGFRARWSISNPAAAPSAQEPPETAGFASYEDARDWVHLSAGQAGFGTICWDTDSCPAPEETDAD